MVPAFDPHGRYRATATRALAAALLGCAIFTIAAGNARAADGGVCNGIPGQPEKFRPLATPGDAPTVPFQARDGSAVTISEAAAGKGAVVNFWATWCLPCIKEMPALDNLKALLAKDGIAVIAISQDKGGLQRVEPFYAKHSYRHLDIHLDDASAFARVLKVRGLPTTVLFDAKGRELGRLEGIEEWDTAETVAFIRGCLAKNAT